MKNLFFFFGLFFSGFFLYSQEIHEFFYDEAGNRIVRHVINMRYQAAQNPALPLSIEAEEEKQLTLPTEEEQVQPAKPIQSKWASYELKVYPNPTHGKLKVEIKGGDVIQTGALMLYAADGKPVYSDKKADTSYELDLSSYPNGIYIMRLVLNGKSYDWKIIKE